MLLLKYSLILLHVVFVLGEGPTELDGKIHTNSVTTTAEEVTTKAQPIIIVTTNKQTTTETPLITDATTNSTTSSTTLAPTTVPPASSTPSPSTTVAPKADHWEVVENGTVCILAKMDIKLDLKLSAHSKDIAYTVPQEAVANGSCGKNQQSLVLSWDKNNLTMLFKENETSDKYYLESVAVEIKADNNTINLSEENITMFETAMNHSYLCSYSEPLKFSQNNKTIQFSFSNIKLEAFKLDNSTSFSNVSACPPDTPDIVPIVVGCALTVLVVVVLIAYLVSRRRTQARGYLSM